MKPLRLLVTTLVLTFTAARLAAQATHSEAEMATWRKASTNRIVAQKIVNNMMAAHPEVLIIGIHGIAPGAKGGTMIATNLDRVGKVSDEDDNAVADDHRIILELSKTDPNRYEVLIWMKDASGKGLDAAVGFVLKYAGRESDVEMLTKGVALRDELAKKILTWDAIFAPAKL